MTEAELCDAFVQAAVEDGWDVYPEHGGFDLLLVWKATRLHPKRLPPGCARAPAGYQIGLEAKLRANVDVLFQGYHHTRRVRVGPDEVGVLVPKATGSFGGVAKALGLRVFDASHYEEPKEGWRARHTIDPAPCYVEPKLKRVRLPAVPLQGSGGQPSPRTMSKWREAALRLCILLDSKGWISGADFKAAGVDRQRWVQGGWIVAAPHLGKDGATTKYVAGDQLAISGPVVGYAAERAALAALEEAA